MIQKVSERDRAISLRKQGKTYGEILKIVPVAKSTLSLWLREVSLSWPQTQQLTAKRVAAQKRGAQARKDQRLTKTREIIDASVSEVGSLSYRERLLIGAALYWAEGAKEKIYRPSVQMDFANSDPEMIRFYVRWLREVLKVSNTDISIVLHLHENHLSRELDHKRYWLEVTDLEMLNFGKTVVKRHKPLTVRKNTGENYHGLVNIRVRRSTALNRQTLGWIYGIISAL